MKKSGLKEIESFFNSKSFALIGVSRQKSKFGNVLFHELNARGKKVIPIHSSISELEGIKCYPDIDSITDKPEAAIISVKKDKSVAALKMIADAGIKKVWIQMGSETEEVVAFCNEAGIVEVHGRCMMMFSDPVKSVHKFHRSLSKLFGSYPK
ncbi:MAG: CoA-binding protein [Bacteroidota bacterium]